MLYLDLETALQQDISQDAGSEGAAEDTQFRLVEQVEPVGGKRSEREVGDEEGYGEPDSSQCRDREEVLHVHPLRHGYQPGADGQIREGEDAQGLSNDQSQEDRQGNLCQRTHADIPERNAGIDEGEERQDDIVDERMELVGDALERADGMVCPRVDVVEDVDLLGREHGCLVRRFRLGSVEHRQELAHVVAEAVEVELRPCRDGEGYQHSGDGRMDTRLQEKHPDAEAEHVVEQSVVYFHLPTGIERGEQEDGNQERLEMNGPTVEERDDNDTADIVHHGQRGQEYPKAQRHALSQQTEDGKGKGDVGRHRDGSPACRSSLVAHSEVEEDGDNHTTARSDDWEQGFPERAKFANQHFLLDFQAYGEEEDRHQRVVYEGQQCHRLAMMGEETELPGMQVYRVEEELLVSVGHRGVG